jgi:YbbR domain-containing protein
VTVAPFENNLVYVLLDQTGAVLLSGPLAVSAAEPGAPGTFDVVVDLGDLAVGSTVRLEIRDLSGADGLLLALDSVELTIK